MTEIHELDSVERQERVIVDRTGGLERQQRIVEDRALARRQRLHRISEGIWLVMGVLQASIGMRILLKLIAADPNNPFANFIYSVTEPFLHPFLGLTRTPAFNGMVLEIPAFIAMLVYALVFWVIVRLIWLIFYRPASIRASVYESYQHDQQP